MQTTFNANPASWLPEVEALWKSMVLDNAGKGEEYVAANFFTARPWRNEYDRGSPNEGFVFTVRADDGLHVCMAQRSVGKPTVQAYARSVTSSTLPDNDV